MFIKKKKKNNKHSLPRLVNNLSSLFSAFLFFVPWVSTLKVKNAGRLITSMCFLSLCLLLTHFRPIVAVHFLLKKLIVHFSIKRRGKCYFIAMGRDMAPVWRSENSSEGFHLPLWGSGH